MQTSATPDHKVTPLDLDMRSIISEKKTLLENVRLRIIKKNVFRCSDKKYHSLGNFTVAKYPFYSHLICALYKNKVHL